jgi:hypothetical protein
MGKYLTVLALIILLALTGYYFFLWKSEGGQEVSPMETPSQQMATSTYSTTTFSTVYPSDFILDTSYEYPFSETKAIGGVKFTIPGAMATGTDLSADSYLSVEQLPRAKNCTGEIYLFEDVKPQQLTDRGVAYSLATSTSAGAGNLYDEQVYALSESDPCTAVRYYIHYANIGNYPDGAVREFDRAALLQAFDEIRRALLLHPAP